MVSITSLASILINVLHITGISVIITNINGCVLNNIQFGIFELDVEASISDDFDGEIADAQEDMLVVDVLVAIATIICIGNHMDSSSIWD